MVLPDEMRYRTTDSSPTFLGLDRSGRTRGRTGYDGEDVVVGVIDYGIWPEHPSFADDGIVRDLAESAARRLSPACEFGNTAHNPDDAPFTCNNKLLGARQMLDTYRCLIGADPDEFDSARTTTATAPTPPRRRPATPACRQSSSASTVGEISGIAPRARVIAYKGLGNLAASAPTWRPPSTRPWPTAWTSSTTRSAAGSACHRRGRHRLPVRRGRGVFVATSSGQLRTRSRRPSARPASVPWLTTVGASTQSRVLRGLGLVERRMGVLRRLASRRGPHELPLVDADDRRRRALRSRHAGSRRG